MIRLERQVAYFRSRFSLFFFLASRGGAVAPAAPPLISKTVSFFLDQRSMLVGVVLPLAFNS